MFRFTWPALIGVFLTRIALAQSPSPPVSPSPASPPTPQKVSPAPTPGPTSQPTTKDLINSLTSADVQAAISLLRSNFTNPDAINETQVNRATLQGLIARLNNGVLLLPGKETAAAETPAPFYSEILEGHIGYLRPGTLTSANLQALDKKVAEFVEKKVDALVLDLRSSSTS